LTPFTVAEFAYRNEQIQKEIRVCLEKFGSVTALGSKAVVESAEAFDYETLPTYLTQKYGGGSQAPT
jgi:hypothetical protein